MQLFLLKGLISPYWNSFCLTLRQIAFLIGTFLFIVPATAQSLTYSVTWNGKSVGQIQAIRKPVNQDWQYVFDSNVAFSLLDEFKVRYSFESLYKAGSLQEASAKNQVNGKMKSYTQVRKTGNGYQVNKDGEQSALAVSSIEHSLSTVYFQEPTHLTRVFSERYAAFLPVERVEPHRYAITLPDGKKNYYTYENGICTLVEVNHRLFNFYFKLIKQSSI